MKNEAYGGINRLFNNIHLEILDHGHFMGDREWNFHNVTSPFNRLYFILDGEALLENNHRQSRLEPGRMYLVPVHTTNHYICEHYFEKFYIHFHTELFFGRDLFERAEDILSAAYDTTRLRALTARLVNGKLEDIFLLKAFLYEALAVFLPQLAEEQESQLDLLYKYRNVYRLIRERRSWKLTPEEISEAAHVPLSSLQKSFKRDTGMSIKACINNMTLQWAKEKILLTDMSFKEIAFSLDFADEFYFSRFIKKHTGLSPKEYRITNKIEI